MAYQIMKSQPIGKRGSATGNASAGTLGWAAKARTSVMGMLSLLGRRSEPRATIAQALWFSRSKPAWVRTPSSAGSQPTTATRLPIPRAQSSAMPSQHVPRPPSGQKRRPVEERQQLDQSRQPDQRRGRDAAFFPGREQPASHQEEIDGITLPQDERIGEERRGECPGDELTPRRDSRKAVQNRREEPRPPSPTSPAQIATATPSGSAARGARMTWKVIGYLASSSTWSAPVVARMRAGP